MQKIEPSACTAPGQRNSVAANAKLHMEREGSFSEWKEQKKWKIMIGVLRTAF